jgi:glucokinase
MDNNIILGVDIGGSHITSALVDVTNGNILEGSSNRERIDAQGSPEDIIKSWCGVMSNSLKTAKHSGKIAIAMPGPFDYKNGISHMKDMGKYDSLYQLNVRSLILTQLNEEVKELRFINDAGCFLQGELSHGAAKAYGRVMGFTLGTGFGSAKGINGSATDANYWCYPFMGGICEDFFSSKWFVAKYSEYSGHEVRNVKELIDNIERSGPLLQVFDEFSMNLGAFLSQIHRKEKFDCVVLGGNIAKASTLFLPQLSYYLKSMSISTPVYISLQGEDAALIGAACSI